MSARSEREPSKKMELNWPFFTGIVCGVCITLFIGRRRILRLNKAKATEASQKNETAPVSKCNDFVLNIHYNKHLNK